MNIRALIVIALLSSPAAGQIGHTEYDPLIERASERWLPGADWVRYRSQLYQESRLDPDAVSPVGARGVAQFMPGTWREVAAILGYSGFSPHVVEPSINAGAYYLSQQMLTWTEPRPYIEVRRLGEAGYNAGTGNIIRAQRICRSMPCGGECRRWDEISRFLHWITGHHAHETIGYIRHIEHRYKLMKVTQ